MPSFLLKLYWDLVLKVIEEKEVSCGDCEWVDVIYIHCPNFMSFLLPLTLPTNLERH